MDHIELIGGRVHNLKNINLKIPKNRIVAITGVSGSGKSSLAFDLLFEEGRTRYLQAIGMPPRLEREKPFDLLTGLSPTVAVEQRTVRYGNPRSTVGTRTGVYNYLRMLYASCAERPCPGCKKPLRRGQTCRSCGAKAEGLEIKHFSFNEPSGMCLTCSGRGYVRVFREEKLVPDPSKNLYEICADARVSFAALRTWMPNLARHYGFGLETPYRDLPPDIRDVFLHGSKGEKMEFTMVSKQYTHKAQKAYEGIIPHLERSMERSLSRYRQQRIEQDYMDRVVCTDCGGNRVNEQARQAVVGGKHIGELANIAIEELAAFLEEAEKRWIHLPEGKALVHKILEDVGRFATMGLSYLHLNRPSQSLSGGENQRLALMTQMSLGLNGCVVILDEPTMGMHELEKESLGKILRELRNSGNTILIVEHDEKLISTADEVLDLGPLSGLQGGEIVFQGPLAGMLKNSESLTGQYLSKKRSYPRKEPKDRRPVDLSKTIRLREISTNNLKNVSTDLPLGLMVGVAGVSGSGKSSMVTDTLVPILQKQLEVSRNKKPEAGASPEYVEDIMDPLEIVRGRVESWRPVESCVVVDQSPIGRNRNSFPASYIGLWDSIRKLFASQPLAKKRKYQEGHFSFNSDRGRCAACKGEGRIALSISFLDEITLSCEECNGSRYISEILEVEYRGKNIRETLDLSVKDALDLFSGEKRIVAYLEILDGIGMGYITLGQPATTLSGGEAQRVKLAKALGQMRRSNTLFVLDEPSTGLHFHDEAKLLTLLDRLVDQGNTVVIIEHNPKIRAFCDHIIELGPQGGPKGGEVIATGAPEELAGHRDSLIGPFLEV
jgi:excinuclease ABC A subunit